MAAMQQRYTIVAMLLHWVIALGIFALIIIGLVMKHASISPMRLFQLFQLHKSIGITVLLAAVARLIWRLSHRPPALPHHMPTTERLAAEAMHWVLYTMMIGLPIIGWAVVSASPFSIPTVLFGTVAWPDLPWIATSPHKDLVEAVAAPLHKYGAWLLILLLLMHIGAVVRHQFVQRDNILSRMLPRLLGRTTR